MYILTTTIDSKQLVEGPVACHHLHQSAKYKKGFNAKGSSGRNLALTFVIVEVNTIISWCHGNSRIQPFLGCLLAIYAKYQKI